MIFLLPCFEVAQVLLVLLRKLLGIEKIRFRNSGKGNWFRVSHVLLGLMGNFGGYFPHKSS